MKSLLILLPIALLFGCTAGVPPAYLFQAKVDVKGARIALIGDTQRTGHIEFFRPDYAFERESIAEQLANDDIDALVILGDMTFWGALPTDWHYFDALMKPIREKNIPMYPVMGNHEYFIDGSTTIQQIKNRFSGFLQTWYSSIVDSVGIIVINSNHSDIGLYEVNEQYRWFKKTIDDWERDPSIQFVVVCSHHPPYTNSSVVDPDKMLSKYFVPVFTKASKTAYWFSGHSHGYERFEINDKVFVVSGGGGGPLQSINCGSNSRFTDRYPGEVHRPFHYCVLERTASTLSMRMVPLSHSMALADSTSVDKIQTLYTTSTH